MNLLDYNLKQLRKTYNKKYENYIITRIIHGINSNTDDIQMITQQYIKRPAGCALTDLYFPQFKIHIEIDEPHHFTDSNKILDLNRELEIVEASGHTFIRIKIDSDKDLLTLNKEIDNVIEDLLSLRISQDFKPWKLQDEYSNENNFSKYKNLGLISIDQDIRFKKISDAVTCLDQKVAGMQKSFFKSKNYNDTNFWFPKFYKNTLWDNKLVEDDFFLNLNDCLYGDLIQEKPENEELIEKHVNKHKYENIKRIVLPRFIDNLGYIVYKFMGIYKADENLSSLENGMIYRRIDNKLILK